MYFKNFNEKTREILNKDYKKFNVLSWIIFNTNYQEEYNGLKNRECYFSCSVMEKLFDISHVKVLRVMKELEEEGFIKWVYKSNSKGKKSIIYLCESEPVSEPVGEPVSEPVQSLDNTGIEGYHEPVKKPVSEPVGEPLSRNISINKSNIYNVIFDFWNEKEIIVHRSLTTKIEKAIDKALKEYTVEQIKQAIDNYNTVIKDNGYFFSYKWTLIEFLTRAKEGIKQISMFLEDGSQWINYQNSKLNSQDKNTSISKEAEPIKMEVWG